MMRRLLIGLALLCVALVVSALLAWQSMQRYLDTPMPIGEDYALTVERGATLGRVLDRLAADGVSEAENADGEQFGEDRIVELVAEHRTENASELERTISQTVLAHAGGELQDDLTLVVVAIE